MDWSRLGDILILRKAGESSDPLGFLGLSAASLFSEALSCHWSQLISAVI